MAFAAWQADRTSGSTISSTVNAADCRQRFTGNIGDAHLLDRLLHHAHVLKCDLRSWRTKVHTDLRPEAAAQ
jgi:hypothetical protein